MKSSVSNKRPKVAIQFVNAALCVVLSTVLLGAFAQAQDGGFSLGELARRERERKASAAQSQKAADKVIDLLDLKRDCGADWNCFLTALNEGKPARIAFPDTIDATYSSKKASSEPLGDSAATSTDAPAAGPADALADDAQDHFEGMAIHSDVILETDRLTQDSAVLSGTTKNTTVLLTDPERARLLLRGYTRDAIDARERQAQEKAKSQDGMFVTCLFQKRALQQFLESRKEGEFSDRDWEFADHCDGPERPASSNLPASSSKP